IVARSGLVTVTSIVEVNGRIKARFDRVCGQIGVRANTCAVGKTTAPPAAREYAVEPVGELTINPSHRYRVSGSPSTCTSNSIRRDALPRLITISLSAL